MVRIESDSEIDLTGPCATPEWPFPGEVHVLTAWDPFGRSRSREANEEQNALLSAELTRRGGGIVPADGYTPEGEYLDSGLVVRGLDTNAVREIARGYGQEAIYRLTAETLQVLATFTDLMVERARVAPDGGSPS